MRTTTTKTTTTKSSAAASRCTLRRRAATRRSPSCWAAAANSLTPLASISLPTSRNKGGSSTDEALAKRCVDAGWDSVMVDYSALPYEENAEKTRAMVVYAHARNVTVEGEIGVIAGVEDDIHSEHSTLATFEDTMRFVSETGIDAVAPAIGTAHGVYKTAPKLNFELVERFGGESIPLVVHGGTGLTADVFRRLIQLGVAKINISTALKKIYLGSSRELLKDEKAAPVEFDAAVRKACEDEMVRYIALFGGVSETL